MKIPHEVYEKQFQYTLQYQRHGNQSPPTNILRTPQFIRRHPSGSSSSQRFDRSTDIDEQKDDSVRIEGRVHGQVVHQAREDIVFGGGVDWWTGEDEDRL